MKENYIKYFTNAITFLIHDDCIKIIAKLTEYKNEYSSNNDTLLKQGKLAYEWAFDNMKIIKKIRNNNKNIKPLSGYKLGFCLHLTKETSVLLMAAKSLGAQISICSANPLSVKEDIVEFLKYNEILVFAKKNQEKKEFFNNILKIISTKPDIIIDDGAELHRIAHSREVKTIKGGTEETTSGILRILSLKFNNKLKYPIIGVNNARTKHLFDNRYGTGQSTIDGLLRTIGVLIAGRHFVVCGYGWVGKGIASSLRGLGARVTITEVNPVKALEAHLDGFNVERLRDVLPKGDCFITCTGQRDVIGKYDFAMMKNGVFLANAGHFDVEIDIGYLLIQDKSPKQLRPYLECYHVNGKKIFLIAKGRVINLIAGEGNASEVMDMSFANQLLSILHIAKNNKSLENKLYPVPLEIDDQIAHLALSSFGINIDTLTKSQIKYYKNSFKYNFQC